MNEKDYMNLLKKDIEIPDAVWDKAQDAFSQIKMEASADKQRKTDFVSGSRKQTGRIRRYSQKKLVLVAAAVFAMSAVTVAANAYREWSRSLEKELAVTEEQKLKLETDGVADMPNQSVTNEGVTVTLQQSIVDSYNGYLSFKVEGFEFPEGALPGVEFTNVLIDEQIIFLESTFYNGIVTGTDGMAVYDDGTPLESDENGYAAFHYVQDDGSLELRVNLQMDGSGQNLVGKPIHVLLKNLGVYEEDGFETMVEGSWSFDWTLSGSDVTTKYELDERLVDTGVTVTSVEISPITLKVMYDAPRQIERETAVNEYTNETVTFEMFVEPPQPVGVRLKDGTLLSGILTGSSQAGYLNETEDTYYTLMGSGRILDVEEIEAILLAKSYPDSEGEAFTEDDLYIVSLGNVTDES